MASDIFYALRVLRKSPHFAITAIVLLAPLPYHDPARIAVVLGNSPAGGPFPLPPADFLDLRAQNRSFTDIAAAELWSPSLTGDGEAEELPGIHTETSLF